MKTLIQIAQVVIALFIPLLCLTSLVFATPAIATAQPEATISRNDAVAYIPFNFDPLVERGIVVQVRIGKHKPLPFLVDTGFDAPVIVERWAAKELSLPTNGPILKLNPGNGTGYITSPLDVALVGAKSGNKGITRQFPVYVADLNMKITLMGRIAGIIGLPFLKGANLQIDFPRRQLSFLPLTNPLALPSGATEIALRPDTNPAFYDAILPAAPGLSAPAEDLTLLLDTGSDGCLLPPYLIPNLQPTVATLGSHTTLAGSGTAANYFIPSLKLGPITAQNVLVDEAFSTRGLLGLDILSQFVVTLEWAGQRMWLTPTSTHAAAYGATDVQLTEVNGHILVDQVAPGSPAAQAGLRSEQKVFRVDGHETDGVDRAEVELALAGYAGTAAKVTVEDSAGRRDIVFMRRSIGDPAAYAGIGMRLVHPERTHTKWYVQTLLCTSRAYQHGIRPGDFIMAVGKTKIELMPLPAVEQLWRNMAAGTEVTTRRPVTAPLPIVTTVPFPLHDLSKISPKARREIEEMLKQGYTATEKPNGGFTLTPPPDDKPAVNNEGVHGNDADTLRKSGTH